MNTLFKAPEPLSLDGNIFENWKRFQQKFDLFLTATDLSTQPEKKQIAVFLNLIGDDGLELFNSFTLTDAESQSLKQIKDKFQQYCSPKKNIIFERYKFNSIIQNEGQTFDNFVSELRKGIKTTQYAEADEMIRDRIVMGISDKAVQERLLREADLTLNKAIDICRASEASKSQSKALQCQTVVNAVKPKCNKWKDGKQICKYCGYTHYKNGRCPAYGKTCAKCLGKNHFANVCMKSEVTANTKEEKTAETNKKLKNKKRQVHDVAVEECDSDSDKEETELYVDSIKAICSANTKVISDESVWTQEVLANGQNVLFKLDTGTEAMNTAPIAPRKDDLSIPSGSGKRSTRNTSDGEGWSTASSRSRQEFSVHSDKLKNKPPQIDDPLGSCQLFGTWTRGSNIKPNTLTPSMGNIFAPLINIGNDVDKRSPMNYSYKDTCHSKDTSLERNFKPNFEDGRGSRSGSQHRPHDNSQQSKPLMISQQNQSGLTCEQIHDKLLEFFSTDTLLDDIFCWIDANVGERAKEKQFVRTLATAVFEDLIVRSKLKTENLRKHYSLLIRIIDGRLDYELECLYALQALINKLEHPQGTLLSICSSLYDDNIFSHDSFVEWETSDNPTEQEGKGVALKQLTSFFTQLKEVDEETSSTEDA